jgi:hypothetical protein
MNDTEKNSLDVTKVLVTRLVLGFYPPVLEYEVEEFTGLRRIYTRMPQN